MWLTAEENRNTCIRHRDIRLPWEYRTPRQGDEGIDELDLIVDYQDGRHYKVLFSETPLVSK